MLTIQYYNGRAWITINDLVYPNQQTYGIDGGTDTMQISFYTSKTFLIPVNTPVRIMYNNEYRYFIVKANNFSDMQYPNLHYTLAEKQERLCTLQLVEPIELLKGYPIHACSFASKRYTLQQIVRKLCRIARFEYGAINFENMDNYNVNRIDFPATTLYLALNELARQYDTIPYLEFETGRWTIKTQRLDGLNSQTYNGAEILTPFQQGQQDNMGVAKRVYIEATNIQLRGYGLSTVTPIASDGSSTITIDNFALSNTDVINDLQQVVITAEGGKAIPFSSGQYLTLYIFTQDETGALYTRETTKRIQIVSKSAYDGLSSTERNDKNKIYIYWQDNIIYLHELKKFANSSNQLEQWDWIYFVLQKSETYTDTVGRIHSRSNPIWTKSFKIYSSIITSNQIPFYAFNNSDFDNTVYYNQTSNTLDPSKLGSTLQSYIDNMQNGKLFRQGIFKSWNDIPKEGSIITIDYTNYIVNSLTIVDNNTYFDVTFNLVQNHAQRRDYMGADTSLQLNDISDKEVVNSNNITVVEIDYSILEPIELINDYDPSIEHMALVAPLKGNSAVNWHWYCTFLSSFGTTLSYTYNYEIDGIADSLGNSLVFYAKALNNMVIYSKPDDNGNLIPYNYTNPNGEVRQVNIKLQNENDNDMFTTTLGGTTAIPCKDKHEVFTQTIQFLYKGVNGTIVRPEYVNLMLTTDYWRSTYVFCYDRNIGEYEDIESYEIKRQSSGAILINSTTQELIINLNQPLEVTCKSIVIKSDEGVLFIKNFKEDTYINIPLELKIYYNIKNPLPIQTGVKGYDY